MAGLEKNELIVKVMRGMTYSVSLMSSVRDADTFEDCIAAVDRSAQGDKNEPHVEEEEPADATKRD